MRTPLARRSHLCRCALALGLAILAACRNVVSFDGDRCEDVPTDQLALVVRAAPGFVGWGEIVFVGDTLPLLAEVRPIVGGSVDVWGGGGCRVDYGAPVPASIQWSSADSKIGTVTSAGVVRGVAEGTVRINARAQEHGLAGWLDVAVWVRAGA